jgi:hypothetical protein
MVLLRKRGEVANNGLRSGLGNHDVQTHRPPEEARCSIGHLITQRQKAFQQRFAQEPRGDPLTETQLRDTRSLHHGEPAPVAGGGELSDVPLDHPFPVPATLVNASRQRAVVSSSEP